MPPAFEVARWELRRFFKLKDIVLSLVIVAGSGLVGRAIFEFVQRDDQEPVRIVVMQDDLLPGSVASFEHRFDFVAAEGSRAQLEQAVVEKDYDGLLILRSQDEAELIVRKEPAWRQELEQVLTGLRRSDRMAERGLAPHELDRLLAPFSVELVESTQGGGQTERLSRISAFVVVGLMLMGIFLGNSYLFVSITGEKTQRVTEQLMSAISPQAWIDGKLLGLSLLALIQVLSYVAGYLIFLLLSRPLFGVSLQLPQVLGDAAAFGAILLLAVLGFFFWFAFFAAFAASINDPNTSSRSSLIMLPMIPLTPAFFAVGHAESLWVKVLSWLPVSSSSFMAARLVVGDVHPAELAAALLLLVLSVLAMRRIAGKIFGLAMLMVGKEPSLREMARWVREA